MFYQNVLCKIIGATYNKRPLKHCNSNKYLKSATYSQAMSACNADFNCRGIYDDGCNSNGEFFLCPMSAVLETHHVGISKETISYFGEDCVYEKGNLR